jgi:hypothetical protein
VGSGEALTGGRMDVADGRAATVTLSNRRGRKQTLT